MVNQCRSVLPVSKLVRLQITRETIGVPGVKLIAGYSGLSVADAFKHMLRFATEEAKRDCTVVTRSIRETSGWRHTAVLKDASDKEVVVYRLVELGEGSDEKL